MELLEELTLVPLFFDASSMMPGTSLGGIVVLEVGFFLFCGFIAGDSLIDRAGFFCVGKVFRRVFLACPGPEVGSLALRSTGDVVSDLSELRTAS